MPTEKKRALVAQLRERLSRSALIILTDYRGLDVAAITALRRNVQKAGGGYHVVKNTLFGLALQEAGIEGLEGYLEGPTAVAFAYEDPIAVAKAVQDYVRESGILKVKAGWMDGAVLDAQAVKTVASLPPRPILLGQLMGTIQSPVVQLAHALMTGMRQLAYLLKTRAESAESA